MLCLILGLASPATSIASLYYELESGYEKCEDKGLYTITSKSDCEAGLSAVGKLDGNTVTEVNSPNAPNGCSYASKFASVKYLNDWTGTSNYQVQYVCSQADPRGDPPNYYTCICKGPSSPPPPPPPPSPPPSPPTDDSLLDSFLGGISDVLDVGVALAGGNFPFDLKPVNCTVGAVSSVSDCALTCKSGMKSRRSGWELNITTDLDIIPQPEGTADNVGVKLVLSTTGGNSTELVNGVLDNPCVAIPAGVLPGFTFGLCLNLAAVEKRSFFFVENKIEVSMSIDFTVAGKTISIPLPGDHNQAWVCPNPIGIAGMFFIGLFVGLAIGLSCCACKGKKVKVPKKLQEKLPTKMPGTKKKTQTGDGADDPVKV